MLAHCSPSSEWVPVGNTGEIEAARKEAGFSMTCRWLRISVPSNRHSPNIKSIRDIPLPIYLTLVLQFRSYQSYCTFLLNIFGCIVDFHSIQFNFRL